MTEPTTAPASKPTLEIVITILLSVAAVATAWSSYQANRWTGEQAKAASHTNALRIDAARAQGLAEDETQVDVALFIQWVDAFAKDDATLQAFYVERFRPEFKPAFEAWIAAAPFDTPGAPLSPFAVPEYRLDATRDARELDAQAEASSETVQRFIQQSSNYVLAVVLFAAVLFFAGISTKLQSPKARLLLVVIGCMLFVGTVAWIATFPVTVSV